ncbi:glycosyltransferase family 2 protein [Streptomyces lydicus]|uniref:glycosyltransferase family 2 protein n=1 Tax=Streptomyces lydicus TaxID=47763 RepID=UPI0036FC67D5
MRVAVITLAAGRARHLRLQQDGLAAGARTPDHYVVVSMSDPAVHEVVAGRQPAAETVTVPLSAAGRLPLAAARNAGAKRALAAGAELLVFLDVDCVPGEHMLARYADTARADALLCGTVAYLPPPPREGYRLGTISRLASPHPGRPAPAKTEVIRSGDHRLFWSLSFAVTAGTWRKVGGFCEDYTGYGGEDTDFALTAATRGVDLWWVGGAPAYHQYHPVSRPPVEHLDDILRNGALFKGRWGTWPMEGWLHHFADLGLVVHESHSDNWYKTRDARQADHERGRPG